ncbi:three-Cys-motif partner protein TcmP [Nocardioides sp.]|uniref:three-Cys-motif partner protein TcmP n=1 Tax=Nocardioides sp. TaxID=35761 RepID=UPI002CA9EC5C|nr:three-Cys-motif partner protein TcmP [Nocardioides sp.]HXH77343.1 three-Cys-motif partner protein TcmP [Nocardioides sp.]
MSKGTDAGLLDQPKAQSVYKHGILDQYAIRFAAMTASTLKPKRAVLFDGFAGRGRFDDGSAGSGEHMMLHAQKIKHSTQIDVFLVEQNPSDWAKLEAVADEYRARGINIETRNADCADHLDEVYRYAAGASLFMFLDPCGAVLPFQTLHPLLTRRGDWPRTEFLMNFSADLIRRAGGQYKKGQLDSPGIAQADRVCGGDWWREVALGAHEASGGVSWEGAAEAVAIEYSKRLTAGTRFDWAVTPVRRQVHHQPVYFLIFLTTKPHGFWVFGDASSRAREKWLTFLGPDEEELDYMLFDTVADQLKREHKTAIATITSNLRSLCAKGGTYPVVQHWAEIFGDVYGEAKETAFSVALRQLVKDGEIEFVNRGGKPHQHVIRRAPEITP